MIGTAHASNSSDQVSFGERYRYYRDLWSAYQEEGAVVQVSDLAQDYEQVQACVRSHGGRSVERMRAVEIGFGARPYRLIYFNARGLDVRGIDMDQPLLTGGPLEATRIARRNGALRAAKSLLRYWAFEWRKRGAFLQHLNAINPGYVFDPRRLIVADAGTEDAWRSLGQPDLIYSCRVFEHIDPASLSSLVDLMHRHLAPDGLCYLIITVHTGITGGHLPEWYSSRLHRTAKRSEPWDHLRRRQYRADTSLNKLTRRDYVKLLSRHFVILEDTPLLPDLGRQYLTEDIRAELAAFDDYELFSNDVLFVLQPRDVRHGA